MKNTETNTNTLPQKTKIGISVWTGADTGENLRFT